MAIIPLHVCVVLVELLIRVLARNPNSSGVNEDTATIDFEGFIPVSLRLSTKFRYLVFCFVRSARSNAHMFIF